MKKYLIILLLTFATTFLFSETIKKSFEFEKPTIKKQNKFTILSYKNCINYGTENQPELPHYNINLLLPKGEVIKIVKILNIEYYDKLDKILLKPTFGQFPISRPPKNYNPVLDKVAYGSDFYPESQITKAVTSFLSGHSIGSFQIIPIKYLPNLKTILPIKKITLKIITQKSENAQAALENYKNNDYILKRIKNIVSNFNDYKKLYPDISQKSRDEDYDLLLITNQTLLPAFSDYIDFKSSIGFFVAVKTTEDIYNEYQGVDNQEKIRNCIIDYYQNHNLKYVLLGGDADGGDSQQNIVPVRGMTVIIGNSDYDEHNLPSDIYYSNLDGSWNDDNDNFWGESGEIDFYSEVAVGRICADTPQEVLNFTNKIITYETHPVNDDVKKALMLGEQLDDTPTWGGDYKDEIAYGSDNNGYHTNPLPFTYEISRLYEKEQNWSKFDVFDFFDNEGVHFLNHLGHSNPNYNMKMENSDLNTDNFTNDGISRSYVIGYSQGCYNGSFDNWIWDGYYLDIDCIAEDITDLATGEVASIANSRYGWYMPGGTNSSSQYYDRQFFDTVFNRDFYKIGVCNSFSKEKDVMLIGSNPFYKWAAFETNLFGDPSMDIWTDVPTDFDFVSVPQTIYIGATYVDVILPDLHSTIAVSKDNILLGRVMDTDNSLVRVNFSNPINEACNLTVTVTAHNKNMYSTSINVLPSNAPYLAPIDFSFVEENGVINQVVDHGETLDLYFNIKNFGSVDATDIVATISSQDPNLQIISGNLSFGSIESNSTYQNQEPFIVRISSYCPDNYNIPIQLNLTASEGEWQSERELNVKSPMINLSSYNLFTDSHNYLTPNESAYLNISLKNMGLGIAHKVNAVLSESDPYITINNGSILLDDINPNQEMEFPENFTFNISEDCPQLYNFNFTLEITDSLGYYNILQIPVNVGYKNKVENGEEGWIHYSMNEMVDQWHISQNRSFSPSHSWKVGGVASSNYYNNLKCALETPEIELPENCYFSFYHWINAEVSQNGDGECYDGGLVEIYYNGNWQPLIPINGYPYHTIGNNNPPFENGTGVFSGYSDWQRVYFDLSAYTGTVKFRFVFGSDGAVTGEGWYIDDVALVSEINNVNPPTNLKASLQDNSIHLTWKDTQEGVLSFNVYRKNSIEGNFQFIGNTDGFEYFDIPQDTGVYFYVVTALDATQESNYSNLATVEYSSLNHNTDVVQNRFMLMQNYPNPFNPTTTISFNISQNNTDVNLSIYNLKGQKVITLINGRLNAGIHSIVWNGKDKSGHRASSGVYFYRLKAKKNISFKKMMLLK